MSMTSVLNCFSGAEKQHLKTAPEKQLLLIELKLSHIYIYIYILFIYIYIYR